MVRVVVVAAIFAAVGLGSAPATVAQSAVRVASIAHDEAPAPSVTQADTPGSSWEASNSCYYPNCTAAHKAGEGDIPSSSDHYCSKQDRDGDGIACEW
jgi:hypothetical protein